MKRHFSDYWIKNKIIDISKKDIFGTVSVHWHEFYELEIIVSGGGYYYIDGNKHKIKEGCLFFMSPTSFHSLELTEKTTLINVMFEANKFNENLLCKLFFDCLYIYSEPKKEDLSLIINIINDISLHLKEKTIDEEYVFSMFNAVLTKINKISKSNKITGEILPVQKSLLFIHNNFKSNITVNDAANLTHYSTTYFCSIFKKYTGKSFTDYIFDLRMSHAENLIRYTSYNITEICMECGFKDYSHFTAKFKEKNKLTPLQYRTQCSMLNA